MLRFILAILVTSAVATAPVDNTGETEVAVAKTVRDLCEPADERWKLGPEGRKDVKSGDLIESFKIEKITRRLDG